MWDVLFSRFFHFFKVFRWWWPNLRFISGILDFFQLIFMICCFANKLCLLLPSCLLWQQARTHNRQHGEVIFIILNTHTLRYLTNSSFLDEHETRASLWFKILPRNFLQQKPEKVIQTIYKYSPQPSCTLFSGIFRIISTTRSNLLLVARTQSYHSAFLSFLSCFEFGLIFLPALVLVISGFFIIFFWIPYSHLFLFFKSSIFSSILHPLQIIFTHTKHHILFKHAPLHHPPSYHFVRFFSHFKSSSLSNLSLISFVFFCPIKLSFSLNLTNTK